MPVNGGFGAGKVSGSCLLSPYKKVSKWKKSDGKMKEKWRISDEWWQNESIVIYIKTVVYMIWCDGWR